MIDSILELWLWTFQDISGLIHRDDISRHIKTYQDNSRHIKIVYSLTTGEQGPRKAGATSEHEFPAQASKGFTYVLDKRPNGAAQLCTLFKTYHDISRHQD